MSQKTCLQKLVPQLHVHLEGNGDLRWRKWAISAKNAEMARFLWEKCARWTAPLWEGGGGRNLSRLLVPCAFPCIRSGSPAVYG